MNEQDRGLEMIERLANTLQLDDAWSVRAERGFTWWSHRLAQHVRAERMKMLDGTPTWTVRVRTDVLRDVPDARAAIGLTAAVNGRETLSALVFDPTERTLSECCTGIVHAGNLDWMHQVLGLAAVLQNAAAHSRAHPAAGALGGTIAESRHPASGVRPDSDDLLTVAAETMAAGRSQPSAFAGSLIGALPAFAESQGLVGFGDASAFSCEIPLPDPGPEAADGDGSKTALVRFFADQQHPDFGTGALCTLRFPVSFGSDGAAQEAANRMNLAEATRGTRTSLVGAWTTIGSLPSEEVAFTCFLPNLLARPGVLENVLLIFVARSRFAALQL